MGQDPSNGNDLNVNNIPGYQRTTSSIYNLIHSSNNSNLRAQEGVSEENGTMNGSTTNKDKSFNIIPQGQNFNSYYMGDTNNRPMLPSLPKPNTSPPQGRTISQHSNISIPNLPPYDRSSSNDNTLNTLLHKDGHDTPYYKHLNNLSRVPSTLSNFKPTPFSTESPQSTRTFPIPNSLQPGTNANQNFMKTDNKNGELPGQNTSIPFVTAQHPTNENLQYAYNESTNVTNIASSNESSRNNTNASSATTATNTTTTAFKPTTKSKINNTLLASRRNTQELVAKSIAEKYLDKPISEYASVVKEAELDVLHINPAIQSKASIQVLEQKKERERQVYALLWLMKNCESQHDSYVPRGRIFAQYASSCAQYNLKPLSQASLGKLIRTVFPGLTTRRLGMRGQSKYHYCGLKLINSDGNENYDDDTDTSSVNVSPSLSKPNSPEAVGVKLEVSDPPLSIKSDNISTEKPKKRKNNITEDSKVSTPINKKSRSDLQRNNETKEPIVAPDNASISLHNVLPNIFKNEVVLSKLYKLSLPPIPKMLLPSNIDQDMISSLESLYHIYCNKIFDNIKYLRFDSLSTNLLFFHTGSVSPQMYNLLISEELNDWIAQCDRITHISLAKYLSNLVLDKTKPSETRNNTVKSLESFVNTYPKQISDLTMELPTTLRNSKTNTAKDFTSLMKKLLKLDKFIIKFLNSFQAFKGDMHRDWDTLNLEDIYDMVSTDKHHEVCKDIKDFLHGNITLLFKEVPSGSDNSSDGTEIIEDPFNTLLLKFLEFVSESTCSANTLINSYIRFTNALIGDISLKSSENLLLWLFFNNVTVQLLNYSFEATKFVAIH
ncbi:similar to Saccharomyces cerevisiae YLR176C RFX1 Major transcriptional repressor of DNA-damage-regulated genes, recruits repressors Tup1p and Cyc8p to their promoters [Maudiozyma saulgeensis]|uniref:Similar to Saccharomyces cerevisiae YLR176C RFX1 Major transcriptional repressor of DNA-damage-regulated genes, recruits repressors Tup1p and Cyc8p to their promoters n=1 Tax=Maudiozyma saulgeensis TaxID=1789683 RepID=A0A1X7R8D9_9SACH|nr:similar to Saccharomyces cerevisiae YLR176C RFX1 Major transcriptional repressor of DNA-damage-regulated genes, recruits repressors Tup1p and Cyc8p to their promoters [Kazachstania saulgeensis]